MTTTSLNKTQLRSYVGDFSQLFGIKEFTLTGGKANGLKALDVNNGSGLNFTVLPGRCLDISALSFKGINCSYLSKTGLVAPEYYDGAEAGFLRSFYAGFLTTCGLRNVGPSCFDEGEHFGLHGRISNTPAEEVRAFVEWMDDVPVMKVEGKMREATLFGEYLILHRQIKCAFGDNKIFLKNKVENLGFRDEPLMILFHFNLGYPLLSPEARLYIPTMEPIPRDEEAANGIDTYAQLQYPTKGFKEQVFYHQMQADSNGNTFAALVNDALNLALVIRYNTQQLENFTQWKQMGSGEYVTGLEPGNCWVGGRAETRRSGLLKFIAPGEIQSFDLVVEILTGEDDINKLKNEMYVNKIA